MQPKERQKYTQTYTYKQVQRFFFYQETKRTQTHCPKTQTEIKTSYIDVKTEEENLKQYMNGTLNKMYIAKIGSQSFPEPN